MEERAQLILVTEDEGGGGGSEKRLHMWGYAYMSARGDFVNHHWTNDSTPEFRAPPWS
jgi:hypothetical protein